MLTAFPAKMASAMGSPASRGESRYVISMTVGYSARSTIIACFHSGGNAGAPGGDAPEAEPSRKATADRLDTRLVPQPRRLVDEALPHVRLPPALEMLRRVEAHDDDPLLLHAGHRREHLVAEEAREAGRRRIDRILPGLKLSLAPRLHACRDDHAGWSRGGTCAGHRVLSGLAGEEGRAALEKGSAHVRAQPGVEMLERVEPEHDDEVVLEAGHRRHHLGPLESGKRPAPLAHLRLPRG